MPLSPSAERELAIIDDLMREVSRQTDPTELVRIYGNGVRKRTPSDGWVGMSRRHTAPPKFHITRFSGWSEAPDPWTNRSALPMLEGGFLGDLLYADKPVVIEDFSPDPSDPGYEYVKGMRSLITLPQYDNGVAVNCFVIMMKEPNAFPLERYPSMVWQANLFGRATLNMVLKRDLAAAYESLDRELKVVGEIQRSLLPKELPRIPGLELAADYQPSQRAGGDYYDVFPLEGGKWGLFIADVSGHGTPAAVMMAVTHALAHSHPGEPSPPSAFLMRLNRVLAQKYTQETGNFVTAFYAVYDPATRRMQYSCAGHNPPRLLRDGSATLNQVADLPLGIIDDQEYREATITLEPGDVVALYTDGITEAFNDRLDMFGLDRLDEALKVEGDAAARMKEVVRAVDRFCAGRPASDDRTLLVGVVR